MIPLVLALAHASPTEGEVVDYRGFLDQARFFVRKGWFTDAEEQLVQATRHPDGKVDPEVWFLLAQVRYELADLPGAHAAADQALTWSRDPDQAAATREWVDFLGQRFGMVRLEPPRAGLNTTVDLELQGTILDPELKAWYGRAQERLAGPVDLPLTLGLPAGFTYRFGDHEVVVAANTTTTVPVAVSGVALQSLELSLSAGVGALSSQQLAHLFPAPQSELGLVVPLGPLVTGVRAGVVIQPRETPSGDAAAKAGPTLGVELGLEDFREDALHFRTGLALRYTLQSGMRMGCVDRQCTLFGAEGSQVEGVSPAWLPGVWGQVLWLDRSRSSSVGVGLRFVGERAFGRAEGDVRADSPVAQTLASPDELLQQPTSWQAWGFRGLFDVSFAL